MAILPSSLPTTIDLPAPPPVDAPVLAAYRTAAGRWSIVAPCCRDLSGRIGVRRIATLEEPAAAATAAGGAKVIKLNERAGIDRGV